MPLHWTTPEISDKEWIIAISPQQGIVGCDSAFATMFLWRKMCRMQIARYDNFLLRQIDCVRGRTGFGFPIGREPVAGDNLRELIEILADESAAEGKPLQLYGITESGKQELEQIFPGRFQFLTSPDYSDYIFSQNSLADLPGRKYHKIRNRISLFHRHYPEAEFVLLSRSRLADAAEVERNWRAEHTDQTESQAKMREFEHLAFSDALTYFDELCLQGMIVYCGGIPAAVSIVSGINAEICGLHFEKAVEPYASSGGYAAVRNQFAKALGTFRWMNLEEDMGLPGLRQAKQAWRPEVMLQKYIAVKN